MIVQERICRDCGISEREVDFYHKENQCVPCRRKYFREWSRKQYTSSIGRSKNLKRLYGITPDEYQSMYTAQEGLCASCGKQGTSLNTEKATADSLYIDHCHETKKVRALLCNSCNVALGHLQESPERIRLLLAYAERFEGKR